VSREYHATYNARSCAPACSARLTPRRRHGCASPIAPAPRGAGSCSTLRRARAPHSFPSPLPALSMARTTHRPFPVYRIYRIIRASSLHRSGVHSTYSSALHRSGLHSTRTVVLYTDCRIRHRSTTVAMRATGAMTGAMRATVSVPTGLRGGRRRQRRAGQGAAIAVCIATTHGLMGATAASPHGLS
jgi:hypothetical protein